MFLSVIFMLVLLPNHENVRYSLHNKGKRRFKDTVRLSTMEYLLDNLRLLTICVVACAIFVTTHIAPGSLNESSKDHNLSHQLFKSVKGI